jgi:hypothetical protein
MRVPKHNWTKEELMLLKDINYSAKTLAEMLNLRIGTIRNKRIELGIKMPFGIKKGQLNPKKMRQEIRTCVGKDCDVTFQVNRASKKKYCSPRCQMITQNPSYKGMPRPQRNPNVKEYTRYSRKVHGLSQKTYELNKNIINPNNYPRTLCGVEGGWQLDHIIPIKECYNKGMSIEEAAGLDNLRMLPWKTNLMRNFK